MGTFGCYNLSADELQEFLNDGYILHGTFDTADECAMNCPPAAASSSSSPGAASASSSSSASSVPSILTSCCPNPIPLTLFATLSDGGGCSAVAPQTIEIDYLTTSGTWVSGSTLPTLSLACVNLGGGVFQWQLTSSNCSFGPVTPSSVTCNPIQLVFNVAVPVLACCGIGGGTLNITITQ